MIPGNLGDKLLDADPLAEGRAIELAQFRAGALGERVKLDQPDEAELLLGPLEPLDRVPRLPQVRVCMPRG